MRNTYNHFFVLLLLVLLTQFIASTPIMVVRRVHSPTYYQTIQQLERMIDNEKVLRRNRKSIPDGYFNEFTVLDVLDRQRRGQPISDYTDEFSADPFEYPLRSLKKQAKQ
ncbi:unnamed protein product [Caenorhabditis brenneri]